MKETIAVGLVCVLAACAPKPEPAPPAKPGPQSSFDVLLQNLRENQTRQLPPGGLTDDERTVVTRQLEDCWKAPPGIDIRKTAINLKLAMNRDGSVQSVQLLNADKIHDAAGHAAAGSALLAFQDPRCRQLKFPPDKYAVWQSFTITLDGSLFDFRPGH